MEDKTPTLDDKIKELFGDEPAPEPEPVAEAPKPEAVFEEEPERGEAEAAPQETPEVEAEAPTEAPAEAEAPRDPRLRWFVIHTYSGYENKVKTNLERRTKTMHGKGGEKVAQVLVPTEKEKEIKGGKRREIDRKIYPGYVLVEMVMDDDSWYVVRNTPGVTGFVGSGARPVSLEDQEVKRLLKQIHDETPKYRINFQKGSMVRITSGPFMDFTGQVDDVMVEKEKVRVLVSIFGRSTPVELNFGDVEKV
ncbi:MAG: transcription termination/antitermination factor NusG [Armatimonadetes bacterium]|nr:transcription termination/antitermination factor NusG [Armatimonadota bacterium]MBI2246849.1 transcription termination/antitermination factor NusG [Armatimonadota bacterium]MBI2973584.1 transcription termination/antitermination factor NusG [Armatimonadota bacterium]